MFLAEDTSLHRKVALKFLPSTMQQAHEDHDSNLPYISCFPQWEALRSEPGFREKWDGYLFRFQWTCGVNGFSSEIGACANLFLQLPLF